jgi:hypothetical protein
MSSIIAESPSGIVEELVRVLKPNGLLYFTVNVHHPIYSAARPRMQAGVRWGCRLRWDRLPITPTHLTPTSAKRLFEGLPINVLSERTGIDEAKARARTRPPRHFGDRLKRVFYKNALFEIVAEKI